MIILKNFIIYDNHSFAQLKDYLKSVVQNTSQINIKYSIKYKLFVLSYMVSRIFI